MWTRRRLLQAGVAGALLFPRLLRAESSLFDLSAPAVRVGLETLLDAHVKSLSGMRVGLLCNHASVDSHGNHAIDLLRNASCLSLTTLFAPEHGLHGRVIAGQVADEVDEATGLPVWSLHGTHRKPTPAMLADLDVLLIDLQDIGARFYTYASTVALTMQAAGASGVPVWVLDRPNPIGGEQIHGPVLDPGCASFLGLYPVPVRHGLTMGEWAQLVQGAFQVDCDVRVIQLTGWTRGMHWPDTGRDWIAPSPSLWRAETALTYPGVCFFEGTNCSVGGSTLTPYEVVAAPWLDATKAAAALTSQGWTGVAFEEVTYTPLKPNDGKYKGEECHGIALRVTDRATFDPVLTACAVLRQIHRQHPKALTFRRPHFRLLAGSDALLETLLTAPGLRPIGSSWNEACDTFATLRAPYLLYPGATRTLAGVLR